MATASGRGLYSEDDQLIGGIRYTDVDTLESINENVRIDETLNVRSSCPASACDLLAVSPGVREWCA